MYDLDSILRWLPIAISIGSVVVAVAAFRKSSQTAKMHVPAPIVARASIDYVSILVDGNNGRRFGISEIRSDYPMTELSATVREDQYGGNIPEYEPLENTEATLVLLRNPPVRNVVFRHQVLPGLTVRVKILSRGDDGLSAWFTLPIF